MAATAAYCVPVTARATLNRIKHASASSPKSKINTYIPIFKQLGQVQGFLCFDGPEIESKTITFGDNFIFAAIKFAVLFSLVLVSRTKTWPGSFELFQV